MIVYFTAVYKNVPIYLRVFLLILQVDYFLLEIVIQIMSIFVQTNFSSKNVLQFF